MTDLSNIKVGNKVFVYDRYNGKALRVVESITPKGFIKVGGRLYRKDGFERGSAGWAFSSITIATEEEILAFRVKAYQLKVKKQLNELEDITYEQAIEIAKIMNWDLPE